MAKIGSKTSFLGEISSLEISDEAQDVAKIGSRKLSCSMKPKMWPRKGQESLLGEICGPDFKMKPKMWIR